MIRKHNKSMNERNELIISEEVIMSKIYMIRAQKVMLDIDLSELYGVETKQLKRAVRRNIGRFPVDFMFELSPEELTNWRRQFGTSNRGKWAHIFLRLYLPNKVYVSWPVC